MVHVFIVHYQLQQQLLVKLLGLDGAVDLTVTGTYCVTTTDLFVSVAGGNGQNGNAFNLTGQSDLYIDGFSQGPGSGNTSVIGAQMEVFCSYLVILLEHQHGLQLLQLL